MKNQKNLNMYGKKSDDTNVEVMQQYFQGNLYKNCPKSNSEHP